MLSFEEYVNEQTLSTESKVEDGKFKWVEKGRVYKSSQGLTFGNELSEMHRRFMSYFGVIHHLTSLIEEAERARSKNPEIERLLKKLKRSPFVEDLDYIAKNVEEEYRVNKNPQARLLLRDISHVRKSFDVLEDVAARYEKLPLLLSHSRVEESKSISQEEKKITIDFDETFNEMQKQEGEIKRFLPKVEKTITKTPVGNAHEQIDKAAEGHQQAVENIEESHDQESHVNNATEADVHRNTLEHHAESPDPEVREHAQEELKKAEKREKSLLRRTGKYATLGGLGVAGIYGAYKGYQHYASKRNSSNERMLSFEDFVDAMD